MIKLISVIGHGTNLIPHFIRHYQKFVDEINFVVYETELHPQLGKEVNEIIKDFNNVNIVKIHQDRLFDWEKVTFLYNQITNEEPNIWWVVADIDEFHIYPNNNLRKLASNCDEYGWDIVRGGFIDRIGPYGEFSELKKDLNIFQQYPYAGFFRYPLSGANPNKICLMKGYIHLTSGQHYALINDETTWRWQGWNHPLINPYSFVEVHHFKWDSTSIERIKMVADVNAAYAYSREYLEMYEELSKNNFKINLDNPEFMFELTNGEPIQSYKQWNKLIRKIISL